MNEIPLLDVQNVCVCVCVTWKVCWGCWGPRLHSDLASYSHHVVGSESHNVAYGFLLAGKRSTDDLHSELHGIMGISAVKKYRLRPRFFYVSFTSFNLFMGAKDLTTRSTMCREMQRMCFPSKKSNGRDCNAQNAADPNTDRHRLILAFTLAGWGPYFE